MKDIIFDDFQVIVNESLIRHRSILDIITKLEESQSKINRAIAKSVTNCGCIKISAEKQKIAYKDIESGNITKSINSHIEGNLCENCKEIIEKEIGHNLFYITSLCSILNLNLYDIFLKEYDKINILDKYALR
ncbi:hypothetical protein CLOACE_07150 [Clostridium acetireducens DSM 10703]|jgi:uncharacterized protein YjcR|uniref:DUF1573 domain-containing protein n=1 Tax=Clostridium acetireducens DSM 10703 TaxID=1121290 RepID=A0A1E8F0J3_9CLOT|nr:DUF1573 domain-containing protein [Clostridium acetireducens]OFI06921.1 hypothetical protein CLOACE_07150 [Clostridium acetireducens DSM 10703]